MKPAYEPPHPSSCVCCLTILSLLLFSTVGGADTVVVVRGGDRSPDNSGDLSGLVDPVIQRSGEIVFSSTVRENGLLVGDKLLRAGPQPGSLAVIVAEGQPSPDGNGNFGSFRLIPFVNDLGEVAFVDDLVNTLDGGGSTSTVFVGRGGGLPLSIVARANAQPIPELGGHGFVNGWPDAFGLNNAGEVVFRGVTTNQVFGLWRGDGTPGSLTRIVGSGDPNPTGDGVFTGATFAGAVPYFVMNEAGQVAFHEFIEVGNTILTGVYRGASVASLVKIARLGEAVPSGDGTYATLGSTLVTSGALALNDRGEVAFGALLGGTSGGNTNNEALFLGSGANTVELVRKGDTVPDGNGRFFGIVLARQYVLNNRGEVLFISAVSGASGGAIGGIFLAASGGVKQVARLNGPAPGGGVFSGLSDIMALNNAGQVVFFASVDAGGFGSEEGLFFYDGGALRAVVREGDTMPGDGTVTRIVITNGLEGESRPERSMLNDLGQVTYAFHTVDSEAIAVWTPDSNVFADGFESGNVSAWSSLAP